MLGEESILPTSGMRACTAVVVEVSYNQKEDGYHGEVEFLDRKEWYRELELLLKDVIHDNGKIKRSPDLQSEAGVAMAKIKAVYGLVAKFEKLRQITNITRHLGTTKHIHNTDAVAFRRQIDRYIDSTSDGVSVGNEFWPIVKIVRISGPFRVLSSGARFVDLPGVRDSNAARDKIAKEYLKNCNTIWIISNSYTCSR